MLKRGKGGASETHRREREKEAFFQLLSHVLRCREEFPSVVHVCVRLLLF